MIFYEYLSTFYDIVLNKLKYLFHNNIKTLPRRKAFMVNSTCINEFAKIQYKTICSFSRSISDQFTKQ